MNTNEEKKCEDSKCSEKPCHKKRKVRKLIALALILIAGILIGMLVGIKKYQRMMNHQAGNYQKHDRYQKSDYKNTMNHNLKNTMNTKAIEMFSYQPAEGKTLDELLAFDTRVKAEYVVEQPGYLNRHTTVSADNLVTVFVYWETEAAVQASQAKAATSTLMQEYIGMMNPETLSFNNLIVKQ